MAKRSDPETIGLFVAGALALGVATVVILASGHFFRRTHEYVVFFRGNVNGLRVGAPVKFKGVEIGAVKDVRLNLKFQEGATRKAAITEITIPVLIDIDQGKLARYGTGTFDLSDPTGIRIAVASGMRAQLAMQSLLTGLLYVDLEMYPNTKPNLVLKANSSIQEIPTIPTALEEAQSAATRVVSALESRRFPEGFLGHFGHPRFHSGYRPGTRDQRNLCQPQPHAGGDERDRIEHPRNVGTDEWPNRAHCPGTP